MSYLPTLFVQPGNSISFLASQDQSAGDVVLIGSRPAVVCSDIDYSENPLGNANITGVFDFPQKAEVISAGARLYWDPTGDPVEGTAGTGAATGTATAYPIGMAAGVQPNGTAATANTDHYVRAVLNEGALAAANGGTANAAGIGITGTAASFVTTVKTIGTLIKTEILIDLQGLNSGGSADDIIGANGAGVAHLGRITAATNGAIIAGRMTCLETPVTGDDDIDVWSATEATGVEDTAISALTETKLCNSGDLVAGTVVALTPPAANQYLYLGGGTGDSSATYTAGILLIEFWGK